jgi:hypothetical protein
MGIYAEKKEGEFQSVKPGTYMARCYRMIEIGTIKEDYNGQEKMLQKVMVSWELPTEKAILDQAKGEEPFAVSKTYTLSMNEKANLRKDLESWRGKGFTEEEAVRFDLTALLGKPCLVAIIQQPSKSNPGKSYTVISSIMPLMKGMECPAQINPTKVLSYEEFNWELFETLSDYTKDKIKSSIEFRMMQEPTQVRDQETGNDENNDIDPLPF